jgi:hypothetical protein
MNYKKIFPVLLLTLINLFSLSQSRFKIVSGEDDSSLPFATIVNFTNKSYLSTSITGEAIISVSPGDSLIISYIGYKDFGFTYNSEREKLIPLYRSAKVLPEIFLFNCKTKKKSILKNPVKPRKKGELFGGVVFSYSDLLKPYAIFIDEIPKNSLITNFSFWLRKHYIGPSDSMMLAPIIIMAYGVDSVTQLPDKPLLSSPIIFSPVKQGKQSLILDSVRLVMPGNGLYFSIQYVMDKKYSWENKHVKTATGADTTESLYGGIFERGVSTGTFKSLIYDPSMKEWVKFIPNDVIGFEIEYKQCTN